MGRRIVEIVVNPPDVISVTATAPDVYAVTVTPAPAVSVVATTTGAQGPTGPAGPGVPSDGATATILTKKSATNYDTEWRDYLANVRSIVFNTAAGETSVVGKLFWDDANGTASLGLKGGNVVLQLGQELLQLVKHADNTGLLDGKVCYAVGSDGANMTVRYAQANSEITSTTTIGVMTETATGGNKAFMTTYGLVRDVNTTGLAEGSIIWLSPTTPGGMTTTKPDAPSHAVMVGICFRTHAVNGVIFVMPQNGFEITELHDVLVTTPANGQSLVYQSGVWVNQTIVLYGTGSPPDPASIPDGTLFVQYA